MTAAELYAYKKWHEMKYPFQPVVLHPSTLIEYQKQICDTEVDIVRQQLTQLSKTLNRAVPNR